MIKYTSVNIPDPCHKIDYDTLPYHPDFRACQFCDKKVYDLRHKDEAYFNKIWKETKGDFCGIFDHKQLERQNNNSLLFTITKFKARFLGLFLGVWSFVGKAQETSVVKPDTTQSFVDTNARAPKNHFNIVSERIGSIDAYKVDVYINGTFYNTFDVADHAYVMLPDSVKKGDKITLKREDRSVGYGHPQTVVKVKKVQFKYGSSESIVVRVTKRRRLTLVPRRRYPVGAPKFRGMY